MIRDNYTGSLIRRGILDPGAITDALVVIAGAGRFFRLLPLQIRKPVTGRLAAISDPANARILPGSPKTAPT